MAEQTDFTAIDTYVDSIISEGNKRKASKDQIDSALDKMFDQYGVDRQEYSAYKNQGDGISQAEALKKQQRQEFGEKIETDPFSMMGAPWSLRRATKEVITGEIKEDPQYKLADYIDRVAKGEKLSDEAKRELSIVAGSTLVSLPFKGAGGIPASAGGGAVGSAAYDIIKGERGAGEIAKRAGEAGIESGVGEAIGYSAFKGIREAGKKFIAGLTGAKEATKLAPTDIGVNLSPIKRAQELAQARGGSLTIDTAFDTNTVEILGSVARGSLIYNPAEAIQKKTVSSLRNQVDNLVDVYKSGAANPEDLLGLFKDSAARGTEVFRRTMDSKYKYLDGLTNPGDKVYNPKKLVDISTVQHFAKQQLQRPSEKLIKNERAIGILKGIAGGDSKLTFTEANRIRSRLSGIGFGTDDIVAGETQGLGKKLSAMVDVNMMKTADRIGGNVKNLYKTVNKDYKAGKQIWNSAFIRRSIDKAPEQFASNVHKLNSNEFKQLMTVLDSSQIPAVKQKFKGVMASNLLAKARDPLTGEYKGARLFKEITQTGDEIPLERVTRVFGKEGAANLRDLSHAIGILEKRTGRGQWGMITKFSQPTGLAMMTFGGQPVIGSALVGGPIAMGKVISSKKTVNTLIKWGEALQKGNLLAARGLADRAMTMLLKHGFVQSDTGENAVQVARQQTNNMFRQQGIPIAQ